MKQASLIQRLIHGSPIHGQSSGTELEQSEALADYFPWHFLQMHKEKFRFAAPLEVISSSVHLMRLPCIDMNHSTRQDSMTDESHWECGVCNSISAFQNRFDLKKKKSYICELQKKSQ